MTRKARSILLIGSILSLLAAGEASAQNIQGAPSVRVANPERQNMSVPKRIVKDKNGNRVFAMPVLGNKKEVKPTTRVSVNTVQQKKGRARFLDRVDEQRKKTEQRRAAQRHVFKAPTAEFLKRWKDDRIEVHDHIELLSDTVRVLFERYPKSCRKIEAKTKEGLGALYCENQPKSKKSPFGLGMTGSYWTYLVKNDVLVGADFEFTTESLAKEKFRKLHEAPCIAKRSFVTPDGKEIDSPLWHVTTGFAFKHHWTRIATNFQDGKFDVDSVAREEAGDLSLGALTIGVTKVSDLPETTAACRILGIDKFERVHEYYGKCFRFEDTAHYQLRFTEKGVLESFVLKPKSAGMVADIASYLTTRFGLPDRCRTSITNHIGVIQKEEPDAVDFKFRYVFPNLANGFVYAGTCERPYLYEASGRFFFTNQSYRETPLEVAYEKRRIAYRTKQGREAERAKRQEGVKNYFETKHAFSVGHYDHEHGKSSKRLANNEVR